MSVPTGRFLPQSLFWRLMGVLLAGLLVAQLLSAAINLAERDRLLLRSGGLQSAERIADTVRLLDSLDASERKRIVAILNVPPQRVTLEKTPTDSQGIAATGTFAAALREFLDDGREIRVAATAFSPLPEARGPGSGYGRRRAMLEGREFVPGMYRFSHDTPAMPGGSAFRAQVQLKDGSWVTFDTHIPDAAASLPLRLFATLAVLLMAVLLLSYLAVRWVTKPLHTLAAAADELGRDIHRPPLTEDGPLEVRRAAAAFNRMQSRLRHLIDDRSRVFAAMSHDLKTPITRLRLRAELLDDEEQRQRFEKDLQEMEAMVVQSLEFMRGLETGQVRQPIDIMALLESLQGDFGENGAGFTIEGEALAPFEGVAPLLKRALANLIDNALRYGREASVAITDTPDCLTLAIRDRGPGIPETELEKVFEPFYRLEASRSRESGGTGLGLSIVRAIIDQHGGTVTLANRSQGGLEVTVRLPRGEDE